MLNQTPTLRRLLINELKDEFVKENFTRIQDFIRFYDLLNSRMQFFTITVTQAVTNFKFVHNLGFTPSDLIQTFLTGPGTITWNYSLFDGTFLDLTTTDALVVRGFIGRFDGNVRF